MKTADKSSRRSGSELITWAKTVWEETEIEKREGEKDKKKRKKRKKIEIDGLGGEVIKIGDLNIEGAKEQ